jgi:ABC-type Mn2+/Zn2+ transport system permease subunit
MGTFVVLKGLAFIGDAVSHAAFPGLVIAYIVGAPLYIGGAIAAVATALEYLLLSLLGVTIVVSIQAVGIIMVVAMLVTPAATAQLLVVRFNRMISVSIVLAAVSAVAGLYLSFYLNLASGASIVLVETLFFAIALVVGPKTGLLSRAAPAVAVRT